MASTGRPGIRGRPPVPRRAHPARGFMMGGRAAPRTLEGVRGEEGEVVTEPFFTVDSDELWPGSAVARVNGEGDPLYLNLHETDKWGKKKAQKAGVRTVFGASKWIRLTGEYSFEMLPDTYLDEESPDDFAERRGSLFVSAPSGSGKTVFVSKYMQAYHDIWPERPVYLVSAVGEDEAFDDDEFAPHRLDLDQIVKWYDEQMFDTREGLQEVLGDTGCLIIFDDVDALSAERAKAVLFMRDQIGLLGRHDAISIVILTHRSAAHKQTGTALRESDNFVEFPVDTALHDLQYMNKRYGGGIPEADTSKLRFLDDPLPTPWVVVHKRAPIWFLTLHNALVYEPGVLDGLRDR